MGRFIFFDLNGATEECVEILAVDAVARTFDAVVTSNHPACALPPCVWPTPILNEGNVLAFDIKAVASPDPGSDLTVVIQA